MAARSPALKLGMIAFATPKSLPSLTTIRSSSTTAQSSSSSKRNAKSTIPPESPSYVTLPEAPFSSEDPIPSQRGFVPVPRKVFDTRDPGRKVRPDYISKTVPEPTNARSQEPVAPDSVRAWKRTLAAARRTNLEDGLKGLYGRHAKKTGDLKARMKAHQEAHADAARQPERDDEFFTRPSVLSTTIKDMAVQPDPKRFERAAESARRTEAVAQTKREARKDALMELYVNAGNFIVDEKGLEAEVERIFAPTYFMRRGDDGTANAWDTWGMQPGMQRMMTEVVHGMSSTGGTLRWGEEHNRNLRRQKKAAEELTGGKLS
jgi:hypothetical protein